jgi:hypothetical protein
MPTSTFMKAAVFRVGGSPFVKRTFSIGDLEISFACSPPRLLAQSHRDDGTDRASDDLGDARGTRGELGRHRSRHE